jgi:hypothetical protein
MSSRPLQSRRSVVKQRKYSAAQGLTQKPRICSDSFCGIGHKIDPRRPDYLYKEALRKCVKVRGDKGVCDAIVQALGLAPHKFHATSSCFNTIREARSLIRNASRHVSGHQVRNARNTRNYRRNALPGMENTKNCTGNGMKCPEWHWELC